ncbi:phosphatase PAP2 family protein [Candidatus Saccharibacteria bacterium]|nr:phosphatase PAP2 family protein [Candidatus Saccharibacteria bacterium]
MDNLIIFGGRYLVFALPLILLWLWLRQSEKEKLKLTVAVLTAAVLAYGLAWLAGQLYFHPRPFVADPSITPLIAHSNDNGFPSEHVLYAMVITTIIYFYRRRLAGLAFLITVIVGVCRVMADVHSTIDIAAGIALGLTAGLAGYWLTKKFLVSQPAVESPPAKGHNPTNQRV